MQASLQWVCRFRKVSGELDVMNADQIKAFVLQKTGISISPNDDFGKIQIG